MWSKIGYKSGGPKIQKILYLEIGDAFEVLPIKYLVSVYEERMKRRLNPCHIFRYCYKYCVINRYKIICL